jgi:hypothetical protein
MAGEEARVSLAGDWPGLVQRGLMASGSWNVHVMDAFLAYSRERCGGSINAAFAVSQLDEAQAMLERTKRNVLSTKI